MTDSRSVMLMSQGILSNRLDGSEETEFLVYLFNQQLTSEAQPAFDNGIESCYNALTSNFDAETLMTSLYKV